MGKRHLEDGYCWRGDLDGEPAVYGIRGDHAADARAIVEAYECAPVGSDLTATEGWYRTVPCRGGEFCGAGECSGSHIVPAKGAGRGAYRLTWVEVTDAR